VERLHLRARTMIKYITRRIVLMGPVVFLVTVIAFALVMILPGDPALAILGDQVARDPVRYAAYRHELGLDKPLADQYLRWLGRTIRGDLGTSIRDLEPVSAAIRDRLAPTLLLGSVALMVALAVAVPTAVYSAIRPGSWMDWAGTTIAVCGMAIPGFWLGILLIYVFAVWHHWLPPSGYIPVTENPQESLRRLILPGVTVASWLTVPLMRQLRASLIEVLQNDYIRTARSKGLGEGKVLGAHALRNALIPVLTVLGGMVGHLYAGTVIGETIFSIPGLGKLVVDSISFRDFPVTQGVVLLAAGSVLLATLITDVLYAVVDPRVRYS
jgi:peptide/nickel transport system permease protein